jgi:hypothetical protein
MAERTEELKREIDDTRDNLGVTLDAIGDRVSPGRIAERRVNRVRQSTGRLRDRVMGARDTAVGRVGDLGSSAGQATGSVAGSVTDSVSGTVHTVGESVSDAASTVTGGIRSAPDAISHTTQGNPLLAGALAFGVGAFVASLLPSTEAEKSVAGGVAEPLKSELSNIGNEVAGTARETAQDALETTRQAAMEAKDQVAQEASGAAQQVKDEASSAKDRVTEEASSARERVSDTASSGGGSSS